MLDIEEFLSAYNSKKVKKYRRNLSPEFIEAARQRILATKPWEKSTGPRTVQGKAKSSQNNFKHGRRSRAMIEVNRIISEVKRGQ
ncbi:hypothetical protein CEN49_22850 [Fischerella thermalis CCMEE 5273]|jgi:hypothetical protein|uniref:hypothetical protein n=1 Tax=Fischerella sp. TaxID=1191 RepID=UPI000C80D128|nr:hypothetical protein [Fischerella sp.]NWF61917.1 hypothetical protein [Fischerella sp.]PMB03564.1 hypothetical protein CEN49_22850 [Fischerella thermalis CCMEE 5273]